jgi:hypothetical protein
MKASKGIPVSDPMARLWGYQYQQKHGVSEISGVPPLHFTSRGEQLLDYRIYGNTVQDGTPAPENPAEVQGVGEQTENLFDKDVAVVYNAYITRGGKWYYANDSRSVRIQVKPNTQYTLSTEGRYTIFRILEMQSDVVPTEQDGFPQMQSILIVYGENQSHYTFETSENAKYIVFQSNLSVVNNWLNELMLVEGNSIRSDYIPYGYKIPVTVSDGRNTVTTPVYIGSEPLHKIRDYADYVDFKRSMVVRRIKKLILTGAEDWSQHSDRKTLFIFYQARDYLHVRANVALCSHFPTLTTVNGWGDIKNSNICTFYYNPNSPNSSVLYVDMSVSSLANFKAFLSEQYEAGTPVTVWYILAEPEEEPLGNLLPIQTIKGSNGLTVDTAVQPSEMYIKYKKG